jgi:molybdate transport system substrate-binding protein
MPMRRALNGLLLCICCFSPACSATPVIAAASDLRFAMDEMVGAFAAETNLAVRVAFGSSGNFARQIEQGAPFELFFSADEAFVRRLAAQALTRDDGRLYAIGRIVVFAPHGSPLAPDPKLTHLGKLIERGAVTRFAIANPEHAPYGRAAQQALSALGLWERLRPKLVLGENVSQAAQFSSAGDVTGGIFAYSLALVPEVQARGRFVLLPEQLHEPLRQRMVLLKNAGATSERFYVYVQTASGRSILRKYGFATPERG